MLALNEFSIFPKPSQDLGLEELSDQLSPMDLQRLTGTWGQDYYWFSNENPTTQPEPNNLLTPCHVLDTCLNIFSPQY